MTSRRDIAAWNTVAAAYAAQAGGADDSFFRRAWPFFERRLGELTGQRILDVGCGHGWLSAHLDAAGAHTHGVDGSKALIEKARRSHPTLSFAIGDLTEPLMFDETFDAAVAHMVLMDLPVLEPVARSVAAALRPGGQFIFTVLHPAFFNQLPSAPADPTPWHRQVSGYLQRETWHIDTFGGHWHYHRPLEDYVNVVTETGLLISAIDEPPTLPGHTREPEEWTEYEHWFASIPTMISIAAIKV